jgi:AmpD protein
VSADAAACHGRVTFRLDPATGLLHGARQVRSPNCDERPGGTAIELIVIHGISLPPGEFGGPWLDALFTNTLDPEAHPYFRVIAAQRVSAHLLVRRNGSVIQYVPLTKRAWHAGVSSYRGRERCNDFSIGIELEGTDEEPYTAAQYAVLGGLLSELRSAYPGIPADAVVGHSDIAPGRKTDPGPVFDWTLVRRGLSIPGNQAVHQPDTPRGKA